MICRLSKLPEESINQGQQGTKGLLFLAGSGDLPVAGGSSEESKRVERNGLGELYGCLSSRDMWCFWPMIICQRWQEIKFCQHFAAKSPTAFKIPQDSVRYRVQ